MIYLFAPPVLLKPNNPNVTYDAIGAINIGKYKFEFYTILDKFLKFIIIYDMNIINTSLLKY